MNLLVSLRAEILKIKGSSIIYLTLLGAAIVPLLQCLFDNDSTEELRVLRKDPWNLYMESGGQALNIMILPLFILLISAMLLQLEHRNHTWKQVLASPQRFSNVFLSKFLVIQLLTIGFMVAYNLLMGLSLVGTDLLKGDLGLWKHGLEWGNFFRGSLRTYSCILAISALQYWLSLRFKNFIIPLAIGFVCWFMAMTMILEWHWPHVSFFPFSYPILSIHPKYQHLFPEVQWYSLGYAVLFLVLGFADFRMKKFKNA